MDSLQLELFYSRPQEELLADILLTEAHGCLLNALEGGSVATVQKKTAGTWEAVLWVKRAILLGFRTGILSEYAGQGGAMFDKSTFPPRAFCLEDSVRLVPGGSSVRRGARLAPGIVVMPPSYINVGASVGAGSMVDSHVLVGSCAWVGERVHLSAGVQVGGVLEPPQARPVVIEDECFVGALSGLFEGIVLRKRVVLAPGIILTSSTTIYDLVNGRELRGEIPEGAVVVPGSRPARGAYAEKNGVSLYAPCIVKYRDGKTDAAVVLEEALR